jgi:hypothetical protein
MLLASTALGRGDGRQPRADDPAAASCSQTSTTSVTEELASLAHHQPLWGSAMAGEALFLGWGSVVRGREQRALEVFQESVAYYGKLQEDGQIERFDAYLLEPHGGDLDGFFLLHGEQSALDAIRSSEEFQRLLARASSVIDNLGLVSAYGGEALAQQMAIFGELAQELPQAK